MPLPASYRLVLILDDGPRQRSRSARTRDRSASRRILIVMIFSFFGLRAAAAQEVPPASATQSTVRLEAEQQRKEGDTYFADGKVEIQYKNFRLRADHVRYNTKTYGATANGHVVFDVDTQHITADSAEFNVQTGAGTFERVRGELRAMHAPDANLLVSPNPLTFDAKEVHRLDSRTYSIDEGWLTVCEPDRPGWKFSASHATIE